MYLFTRLPLVNATQPFVVGSGIFELTKGRKGDAGKGKAYAFDINIACKSTHKDSPTVARSIIAIHIFNVGEQPRYPNNTVLFASGLLVFGVKGQAISFHADAKDVRTLAKGESTSNQGTMFCSYIGAAQKYLEKSGAKGMVDGLLHVGLPLKDDRDSFKTYALIKNIPQEEAAELMINLQEGMIVEVCGPLTQIGFAGNETAPVFEVGSLRSLPGSASTSQSEGTSVASQTATAGASTSDTQLRRIRSRSASPRPSDSKRPPSSPAGEQPSTKRGKAEGVVALPVMGSRSAGADREVVVKQEKQQ